MTVDYEWAAAAEGHSFEPLPDGCPGVECGAPAVLYHDSDEVRTARCEAGHIYGVTRLQWDVSFSSQWRLQRSNLPACAAVKLNRVEEQRPATLVLAAVEVPALLAVSEALAARSTPARCWPHPVLVGPPGVGKTQLLARWGAKVLADGVDVYYTTPVDYLGYLQDGFSGGSKASATAVRRTRTAAVLILDDIAAERGTDWQVEELAKLIDQRYRSNLPTLAATNLPPEQWDTRLGARTASRLREMTLPVYVDGVDLRESRGVL